MMINAQYGNYSVGFDVARYPETRTTISVIDRTNGAIVYSGPLPAEYENTFRMTLLREECQKWDRRIHKQFLKLLEKFKK